MTDASPATPQLGHNVLAAAESFIKSPPPRSATTGCARIDEQVLKGGFRYGEVTSVAGAAGSGKTLVSCTVVEFLSGNGDVLAVMQSSCTKCSYHLNTMDLCIASS